jgi:flagellar biosynthetic protein FlhB
MVGRVPKAAVVLANPTNLAVALEYDPERMEAPVVVAKGARALARRIRELATEHGVPIVERDLAKAIYRRVEVGQPIPAELYPPVAEVLAFVFQARGMTVAA